MSLILWRKKFFCAMCVMSVKKGHENRARIQHKARHHAWETKSLQVGGHSIFLANIKGGVGKSTLTAFLTDYLKDTFAQHKVCLLDTDPQGSAIELLGSSSSVHTARHIPIGDRYDGVNTVTLDGVFRRLISDPSTLTVVDTAGGALGNIWQLVMLSNCVLVPTSLSWSDLRPTIDFVHELSERKEANDMKVPHIIIVPNRISPQQRNLDAVTNAIGDLNVILAPPVSDLSVVRNQAAHFTGMAGVAGTRFHSEIARLGDFIGKYVLSGKLDDYYR